MQLGRDAARLDFVIVGAPKAATTYLHVLLRDHPDVFMPRGESPLFEDPFYNGHVRDELA